MGTQIIKVDRILLTGPMIVKAIKFHLLDDGWYHDPLPIGLVKWLENEIPKDQEIWFKKTDWEEKRSGTHRMLWMMVSAKIDPYELCRWCKTPVDIQAMHRRFSNIIQSWSQKG